MIAPAGEAPLVNLSDIAEIELFILKRMKEFTIGDHASVFKGSGFDLVGLRGWEPGDRPASIDWAQSSLSNFSPMVTREFEQPSNATIVAVADTSLSTRCGMHGVSIAAGIARAVASVGLSAVLFQDQFGVVTFDDQFRLRTATRPRIGRAHVLYCLDLYQRAAMQGAPGEGEMTAAIAGHLRKTSLVPVISDFLFTDAARVIGELALLNSAHDVFLIMMDAAFAFELPPVAAGWIEAFDVETGRTRTLSRREFVRLSARVGEWQSGIERVAREAGLDVVRIGPDPNQLVSTLVEFVAERRLRRV